MKSGFIALLGRPNAGKSTLINALVGEKVAIVSPKPQTTREKITGILTYDGYQMVFTDTPGYHASKNKLGEYMNKSIKTAAAGVDVILVLTDATKKLAEADRAFIAEQFKYNIPIYVLVNKEDAVGFEGVYPMINAIMKFKESFDKNGLIKEILPISAKKGTNVEKLIKMLEKEMNDEQQYFSGDEYTDRSEKFMIAEIIREKALLFLQEEVPHGIGVQIQLVEDKKSVYKIEADIVCEKDSHKIIIIGEEGSMIKLIGERARTDIERLVDKKVYLKLFVKVRADWRNRTGIMDDIGYDGK